MEVSARDILTLRGSGQRANKVTGSYIEPVRPANKMLCYDASFGLSYLQVSVIYLYSLRSTINLLCRQLGGPLRFCYYV